MRIKYLLWPYLTGEGYKDKGIVHKDGPFYPTNFTLSESEWIVPGTEKP